MPEKGDIWGREGERKELRMEGGYYAGLLPWRHREKEMTGGCGCGGDICWVPSNL